MRPKGRFIINANTRSVQKASCSGRDKYVKSGVCSVTTQFDGRNIDTIYSEKITTIFSSKFIENRITAMYMSKTERLILSVMGKELKAIIWLSVHRCVIMGFLTNLI